MFCFVQDVLFQVHHSAEPAKLVPNQMLAACVAYLPSLRRHSQEDAHEFLHLVLDVLDRVVLHTDRAQCSLSELPLVATHGAATPLARETRQTSARRSLAAYTFGGTLQSDITCACGNVSSRVEPFMDLSVDVAMRDSSGELAELARADSNAPEDSTTRASLARHRASCQGCALLLYRCASISKKWQRRWCTLNACTLCRLCKSATRVISTIS